ncbi:MAG: hypothetical protein WCJ33_00205 [Pseudomonadota bacterium]
MNFDDEDEEYDFAARAKEVSEAFKRSPYSTIEEIEKLGFVFEIDDSDEKMLAEEKVAIPINASQQILVAFFNGNNAPNETLLTLWQQETEGEGINFALFRRYFRGGNKQLKTLLLFGLDQNPTDVKLLEDLSFLHEFLPILKELISRYTLACDQENNEEKFTALAQDFENNTGASGYEALYALSSRYTENSFKSRCVNHLITQRNLQNNDVVNF